MRQELRGLLFASALLAAVASAEPSPGPQPLPLPSPPPAAADIAYPGTLTLHVDATDLNHRVLRVRETIPVTAGPLTLLYPAWVPGGHTPRNFVDKLAGLTIAAEGKRVEWVRDPVIVHAFHVEVPRGARTLDVAFDIVTPTDGRQGRITMTDEIVDLQWLTAFLYPAGYFTRRIAVDASLTLPTGWGFGTALEAATTTGATTRFKTVKLDTLADSPVFAGANFRQVILDGGARPVRLDIVADRPGQLAIADAQLTEFRNLVAQADMLFGSRHYDHYDMLLAVSDTLGSIGLEHHRSSENGTRADYLTAWDRTAADHSLIAHEYTHSWNGKFRRAADSWTADFNTPMRNSLLWVYEGQTQFWGVVLAARAGLTTAAQARDALAQIAAAFAARPGRAWRSLADTTDDPITANRRPQPWDSFQRSQDYYNEGLLVWLDADMLIRERSAGKRSLDDFARAFFGVDDGSYAERTYGFDDIVAALNAIEAYDWATFLRVRLDSHTGAPLDGLARGGYRLGWAETPSEYQKGSDTVGKRTDLTWTLGLVVDTKDATLSAVQWDGPAYKAGLTVGAQLIAVNGLPYNADLLLDAIRAAKARPQPIVLIVKSGDRLGSVAVDWHGGLRYPRLDRNDAPARLDTLLAPPEHSSRAPPDGSGPTLAPDSRATSRRQQNQP